MSPWKAEAKVLAATAVSAAVGIVLAVLNDVESNHALLGPLPTAVQGVILVVIPPLASFLAGWFAKHTPRPVPALVAPGDTPATEE